MCLFLLSSLAVWDGMKRHPNKGSLLPSQRGKRENKLHYCCPTQLARHYPSPYTLPTECQGHEWRRGGGGRRGGRGRMGGTIMFCEPRLCLSPEPDCDAGPGFVSAFVHNHWCQGFNRCEDNWAQQWLCAYQGFWIEFNNTHPSLLLWDERSDQCLRTLYCALDKFR